MADHVETLTIPSELAEEITREWNEHAETVKTLDGAEFWRAIAEHDEKLGALYEQVFERVAQVGVLSKIVLTAMHGSRDSARAARRELRENGRTQ